MSSTGVRGVYRRGDRFRAVVTADGQQLYLGTFATLEQAAAAVDEWRADRRTQVRRRRWERDKPVQARRWRYLELIGGPVGDWVAQAACRRVEDPDMFFPAWRGADFGPAIEVCAGCEVRQECLDHALSRPEVHGVWGGTTPQERAAMRRRRGRRVAVACLLVVLMLVGGPAGAQPAPPDHGTGTHEECQTYGCLYSHDVPFVRPGRPQPERPLGIAWSRLPDGPDGRRFERVLWPSGYTPSRRPMWDRVAGCESTWRWHIATGNGYYGGLQAHPATWRAFGGEEFAPMAHQALPEQQIAWGERVAFTGWTRPDGIYVRPQGVRAWPHCGKHLVP